MQIISLQISGFRDNAPNSQFKFRDEHQNLIFDAEGPQKIFIFETILGIIFGFNADERQRFRGSSELNKTFTGLVTMELSERTMIIERDFETDFVACLLSDTKSSRPIFQGKDFVDNGYSRPYLQMLKSIFPIIDKDLFLEVCYDQASDSSNTLSDLLRSLYLLLTPQFKFTSSKLLINDSAKLNREIDSLDMEDAPLDKLELARTGISHLLKINKAVNRLESDVLKLNTLISKIGEKKRKSDTTRGILNDKFSQLSEFNPLQLRADVLLWKSLKQVKTKKEEQLRYNKAKRKRIETMLDKDLEDYGSLPDSFSKDITRFKTKQQQLATGKKVQEELNEEIANIETKQQVQKTFSSTALFVAPAVVFLVSYLLFGANWQVVLPTVGMTIAITFGVLAHLERRMRKKIFSIQEEVHIQQKKIHDNESEIDRIRRQSRFFEKDNELEHHLTRFRKYKQNEVELRRLDKTEAHLIEVLDSDVYTKQLPEYSRKYDMLIDIDRPDLENYLDEYVQVSSNLDKQQFHKEGYPATDELNQLSESYEKIVTELKDTQKSMSLKLHIGNSLTDFNKALDQIDRKIKNIHLQKGMTYA